MGQIASANTLSRVNCKNLNPTTTRDLRILSSCSGSGATRGKLVVGTCNLGRVAEANACHKLLST